MKSTIIITGGAGFLGSNLVDVLIDRDYSVVIYDNLSMGKIQNIEHQIIRPNASFIKGDVRDIELLRSACGEAESSSILPRTRSRATVTLWTR